MINNFKISVNTPEESIRVQKALFKLGYSWYWNGKTVSHTNSPFLYAEKYYILETTHISYGISYGNKKNLFNKCSYPEMSVEEVEKLAESRGLRTK